MNDETNELWADLVHTVRGAPEIVVRGNPTRELIGCTSRWSLGRALITHSGRAMGYKFAFGEAAWIVGGRNDLDYIAQYSSKMREFSDDGKTLFGAYGPKFTQQVSHVVRALVEDTNSRQAVINVWRENPPLTRDTPCTLSWQFFIRGAELHVVSTMRSSDLWLGVPYDIFTVSQVAMAVALRYYRATGTCLSLGELVLNCGSQHLYGTNLEQALKIRTFDADEKLGDFHYAPLQPYMFISDEDHETNRCCDYHLQFLKDMAEGDWAAAESCQWAGDFTLIQGVKSVYDKREAAKAGYAPK